MPLLLFLEGRTAVLNLWVMTPRGEGRITDIYITVQNSSKVAVIK